MFKVEIENKKGEKKIQNCNDEREIYSALRELGNDSLLQRLKIGEDKNGVNLKLLSDNDFDAAIAKILTDNGDTLYDAVLVAKHLNDLKDDAIKEEIERNAINEQYDTKEELYDDICKMKIEFSSVREDFYCPLHVILYDSEGCNIDLAQEDIVRLKEEISEKLKAEQEGREMTPFVGEQANIEDKLIYAEWSVENRKDTLYGKISCYFREILTEKETEMLKEAITGQNSDGFGESFEQHPIKVDSDDVYVSFWDYDDYFLKTGKEMDEYLQKDDITMGGI